MLEGAGYSIDDTGIVTRVIRPDIGLGGIDWNNKDAPSWDDDNSAVYSLLKDFYKPHEGRSELPCMAGFSYAMIDSVIKGIEANIEKGAQAGKGLQSLVQVVTHGPIIDAFAGPIAGYQRVKDNGDSEVTGEYRGAFEMGQTIKGAILVPEENPLVFFDIKGTKRSCRLSDLKEMREMHKEHSQYAGK